MEEQDQHTSRRKLGLAILFSQGTLLAIALGMLGPTLVVRLVARGESAMTIALVEGIWALGILIGTFFYVDVIRRFGALKIRRWALVCYGVILLIISMTESPSLWILLRFTSGLFAGSFWLLNDVDLNMKASVEFRTRTIAIYVVLIGAGFAVSPMLVRFFGYDSFMPFFVGSLFVATALVLTLFQEDFLADLRERSPPGILDLIRVARCNGRLLILGLVAGSFATIPGAFFPLLLIESGHDTATTYNMLTAYSSGQFVLIYIIARIADRYGTGRALWLSFYAISLLGAGVFYFIENSMIILALFFALGMYVDYYYAAGLSLLGSEFQRENLLVPSAVFEVSNNIGGFIGPVLTAQVTDRFGVMSLLVILSLLSLAPAVLLSRGSRTPASA